jgi:hypothetical protein
MKRRKLRIMAAIAAVAVAANAPAAVFTLVPKYEAYFVPSDTGFTNPQPIPNGTPALGSPDSFSYVPGTYQCNFFIHVDGLPAGTSFGSIDWRYSLHNFTTSTTLPDWQPDDRLVDTNGASKGGLAALWDTNALFGTPPNVDVINGVTVGSTLTAIDPRRYVGQTLFAQIAGGQAFGFALEDPTYAGSIYLTYAGVGAASITFEPVNFALRNNTTNQYEVLGGTAGNSFFIGNLPEPAGVAMICALCLPWRARQRRTRHVG